MILRIELEPHEALVLSGVLFANVIGFCLLALGLYAAIPVSLRGTRLALAWLAVLLAPVLSVAVLRSLGPTDLFFAFALPTSGLIVATMAARRSSPRLLDRRS